MVRLKRLDGSGEAVGMRTMPVGEFKAKCLAVMAEVNATGQPVLVTKRGKPLARIVSSQEGAPKEDPEAIFGCLRHMLRTTEGLDDLVHPIIPLKDWDHLKEDWSLSPTE